MISLQRVTKTYKNGVTALTDVTVEVEKGEFVFIVGQSGSGKSTMIRLLLKEEEATEGDIYVGGKNLRKMSSWDVPKLRRNVGTVFQDYKLLTDKTVFENVAFALEVIGKPKHVIDQRVPEILELVGLGEKLNNYPEELSGGEQQRALARPRRADEEDELRLRHVEAGVSECSDLGRIALGHVLELDHAGPQPNWLLRNCDGAPSPANDSRISRRRHAFSAPQAPKA